MIKINTLESQSFSVTARKLMSQTGKEFISTALLVEV